MLLTVNNLVKAALEKGLYSYNYFGINKLFFKKNTMVGRYFGIGTGRYNCLSLLCNFAMFLIIRVLNLVKCVREASVESSLI